MSSENIFVGVASYRDDLLWWTLDSAWKTAAKAGRLVFGVVDQSFKRAEIEKLRAPVRSRLRYVHVQPRDSRGACWARAVVGTLYAEEAYHLQIDAHTYFEPGWDKRLIESIEAISTDSGNSKVILSTRPFGFDLDRNRHPTTTKYTSQSLVLRPAKDVRFANDHPILKFDAFQSGREAPVRGYQLAAGFIFTRGAFIEDVPYDPQLYFHGEEQNLSIRAFTRGWDIWHPDQPPLYHRYKRKVEGGGVSHWNDRDESQRDVRWLDLENSSRRRMSDLLSRGSLTGTYGLGSMRDLSEFKELSGIDYESKTIMSRP